MHKAVHKGVNSSGVQKATFAMGSFWGAEALFRHLQDVLATRVGYMGGSTAMPTSVQVAAGDTGHLEVVEVLFEGDYERLLERYWLAVDPTAVDPNPTGPGNPLLAAIFFHTPEQERAARAGLAEIVTHSPRPITLQLRPADTFWPADARDQLFLELGGAFATCRSEPRRMWLGPELPDIAWNAWQEEDNNELSDEFGPAFQHVCSPDHLRLALVQDSRHYEAAREGLRRWIASRGGQPGEFALDWARIVNLTSAAAAELRVAGNASEYTFWVNFQPGNYAPRSCLGSFPSTEIRASVDAQTGDVIYRYGGSGGSYGVDWLTREQALDHHVGPIPPKPGRDAPRSDESTDGPWWEHVPCTELLVGCGPDGTHAIRWEGGAIRSDADDEVERERTLVALGATSCPCVSLAGVWDPSLYLSDWQRTPARLIGAKIDAGFITPRAGGLDTAWTDDHRAGVLSTLRQAASSGLVITPSVPIDLAALPPAQQSAIIQLRMLCCSLPLAMRSRWLLSILRSLHDRRDDLALADAMQLQEWVLSSVRYPTMAVLWQRCRPSNSIQYAHVRLDYLDDGEPATASGWVEDHAATIDVGISFRWVTHVWGRGMSVVEDHLVLDVQGPPDATTVACEVVQWDSMVVGPGAELVTRFVEASWDGDRWRLDG